MLALGAYIFSCYWINFEISDCTVCGMRVRARTPVIDVGPHSRCLTDYDENSRISVERRPHGYLGTHLPDMRYAYSSQTPD